MGISQAQQMLQQLQQQMQSPTFGQNYMSQLQNSGLGAQNPQNFFSTPMDEQMLRQAVMGRVMGYYGMPNAQSGQYGNIGNPNAILQGRGNTDPYTGGMQVEPQWMQQGFGDKAGWKQAGRPIGLSGGPQQGSGVDPRNLGGDASGGQMGIMPYTGQPSADGPNGMPTYQGGMPGGGIPFGNDMQMGGGAMGGTMGGNGYQFGGGGGGGMQFNQPPSGGSDFYNMMQNYNPQIGALNTDYGQMVRNGFTDIANQNGTGGFPSMGTAGYGAGGSSMGQPASGQGGFGGMFPNGIPSVPNNYVDQGTQSQIDKMNLDFGQQKNDLVTQMFGKGMNASSAAADAGGKLLYGRSAALNDIMGQGANQKLDLYKQMIDLNAKKQANSGGGGISFGGGGGGGGMNPGFGGAQMAPQDMLNIMQGRLGTNSAVPLNFEQQMQMAQLQLQQQQLQQQGQLGFGGLGLQQQLGLGSQGLQGQGLSQDFMSQLLGMGMSRQQGAAGMNQADLARMQQYLMGQSSQFANIGQQNAQMEAQKQSFWKQLALAGIGGASSLLGGMASGGTGFFG